MKNLFVLAALFLLINITKASAQKQNAGDPSGMLQQYKERLKPELITQAKITDEQADKVVDITFENRRKMRGFKDLNENERIKQMEEINASQTKQLKAIPLTDEQVKAVNDFFEERRKQMQSQKKQNAG